VAEAGVVCPRRLLVLRMDVVLLFLLVLVVCGRRRRALARRARACVPLGAWRRRLRLGVARRGVHAAS
jgi:hypothetical protein